MSTATLNGTACTRVTVNLPSWGAWWADVETDGDVVFSGRVALQLADLALSGTVISGGARMGRGSWRIVGGAGGWGKTLSPKSYINDAGIKAQNVLGDAATECGETIADVPTGTVGPAFSRLFGPASGVLQLLYPQSWYVGEDGVTRIGRRASSVVPAAIARGKVDLAANSIELLSDSIAALLPGCVCDGMIAVDVVHILDGKRLRTALYGSAFGTVSKRLIAWARLLDQLRPFDRYRGTWEYRVVSQSGDRLDLQPASSRFGLPDLRAVRTRPGVPGCKATHALGSLVLVAFVNCDPSRPCVVGFDDPESPGFAPGALELVGEDDLLSATPSTNGRVVRYGDTVFLPTGAAGVAAPFQISPTALIPSVSLTVSRVKA